MKKISRLLQTALLGLTGSVALGSLALAQDVPAIDTGDTAFMLVSAALVLLMTPALAFFYGGLVRTKNALNTMMMSFISLGFVGIAWALIGYTLSFTPGNKFMGGLTNIFMNGVGLTPEGVIWPVTIPHVLWVAYQGTFCTLYCLYYPLVCFSVRTSGPHGLGWRLVSQWRSIW
jgi:ammonium transporter, Amt family